MAEPRPRPDARGAAEPSQALLGERAGGGGRQASTMEGRQSSTRLWFLLALAVFMLAYVATVSFAWNALTAPAHEKLARMVVVAGFAALAMLLVYLGNPRWPSFAVGFATGGFWLVLVPTWYQYSADYQWHKSITLSASAILFPHATAVVYSLISGFMVSGIEKKYAAAAIAFAMLCFQLFVDAVIWLIFGKWGMH